MPEHGKSRTRQAIVLQSPHGNPLAIFDRMVETLSSSSIMRIVAPVDVRTTFRWIQAATSLPSPLDALVTDCGLYR